MKKRNGFTLVEIISVIGVLLIISAVAIPSIISINKRNKEKNYEKIVENIKTSSENFIEKYRSDIPFDETTGEYYFKINVLGALNLLKLPIKDPRDNSEISNDSCVKVTKQGDGSLNYEFIASECTINASNPELDMNTDLAYAKVGSTVDLKKYVNDYSSKSTPKGYLKLEIGNLDTSSEGNNKEVIYKVTDLLNGNQTQKTKRFNVLDDQKINVVFLSDSVTKTELDSVDLDRWANTLSAELTNNSPYKDIGIMYNINYEKKSTHIEVSSEKTSYGKLIREFGLEYPDNDNVEYMGVIDNMIIGTNSWYREYCLYGATYTETILIDIENQANHRVSGQCKYTDIENLYCYNVRPCQYRCDGYMGRRVYFYHYKFNGNEYIESGSDSRCEIGDYDSNTTPLERIYNSAKTFSNTHTNPVGTTYLFSDNKDLRKKLGTNSTDYIIDEYRNIFYNSENDIGYLYFYKRVHNFNVISYTPYILWEKKKENFEYELMNENNYDKTYLVITANSGVGHTSENFNITNNIGSKIYLFADNKTLNNINNNAFNEKSYENIDQVLNELNSEIK